MAFGSVLIWVAAAGADQGGGGARLLDQLAQCRAIAADAERLRCFDRAATAVADAQARKDIVVLDKTEVRTAKRSLFGFSLPSIRLFGDGKEDEAVRQLTGTVRAVADLPGGLMRFELDGGAEGGGGLWETTEGARRMPRKGDLVTIKAGALGSYVATASGRSAVRVRRLR